MKSLPASLLFAVLASASVAAEPASPGGGAEGKPEVWILSGQSNACGKADPKPTLPANPAVEILDPAKESWAPAQEPLLGMRHESPGPSKGLGPWLAAALEVAGKTKAGIRLTGTGCDGRPISFWAEGQPGWTVLSDRIKKAGKGADVFLWFQGESDGLANSKTYQEDLKKFVARVRETAESPKMLVVVIQIGPLGMDKLSTAPNGAGVKPLGTK